jgi:hypothetical protein
MSVVEAKIQSVEEMYRLIWTAIENKRPISAVYKERPGCFVPSGWAAIAWDNRACSAINMAATARADWGRPGRRRIGVASFSKNCTGWNC